MKALVKFVIFSFFTVCMVNHKKSSYVQKDTTYEKSLYSIEIVHNTKSLYKVICHKEVKVWSKSIIL